MFAEHQEKVKADKDAAAAEAAAAEKERQERKGGGYPEKAVQKEPTMEKAKSKARGSASGPSGGDGGGGGGGEKRWDPESGKQVTKSELVALYKGVYTNAEINDYWKNYCEKTGGD